MMISYDSDDHNDDVLLVAIQVRQEAYVSDDWLI